LLKAIEAGNQDIETGNQMGIRSLAITFLLLFIMAGRHLVFARPIVFTLLLLAVQLFILERYQTNKQRWLLFLLPLTQIIWSNSQPLFLLGPIVIACTLLGEALAALAAKLRLPGFRPRLRLGEWGWLALTLLAVALACLATPFGLAGLELPFRLLGRIDAGASELFAYGVSENIPPWALERAGVAGLWPFKWLAALAFASFFCNHRNISLTRLGLLLAFGAVALMANRNLLLFYWVAALVIPLNLADWLRPQMARGRRDFLFHLLKSPWPALVTMLVFLWPLGKTMAHNGPINQPAPFRIASESIPSLQKIKTVGPVFNSVRYGGYLIWQLFPHSQAFIDGRLVLRSSEEFAAYLDMLDRPELFHRHDFQTALLPVTKPDRYQRLIGELYRNVDWDLIFTDGTETLFAKTGSHTLLPIDLSRPETRQRILENIRQRPFGHRLAHQQARIHLGLLLNVVGLYDQAEEILAGMESCQAKVLLARSYYMNQKAMAALRLAHEILVDKPEDIDSLLLVAQISFDSKDYDEALQRSEQVLSLDPFNRAARQLLQQIQAKSRGLTKSRPSLLGTAPP